MSSHPVAQGGQADLDGVEAKKEILAKAALVHFAVEIGVGCGEDPRVHNPCFRRPDPFELARLQRAQQLGLLVEGHVGDFVEEEGAAVGHLEPADAVGLGVGECALDVAEELAGEDAVGQPADVDRDQGPIGAC